MHDGLLVERPDHLAVEEPLEIRVDGTALSVTMRTPGHDLDLALGFLLTEGVIVGGGDVAGAISCADNVVDVSLLNGRHDGGAQRNFFMSSSCGLCGKSSIEHVRTKSRYAVHTDDVTIADDVLRSLPDRLRKAQRGFDRTGGHHAAGLFTAAGDLLCVREDVGRHNAVDKVVGWAVQQGRLPLSGTVLQVSGRASFELAQKALMAGIPVLAAVSAPSTLAVDLAAESGLTLVGFLRGASYNVYAAGSRISSSRSSALAAPRR
jgi:FdhD protein